MKVNSLLRMVALFCLCLALACVCVNAFTAQTAQKASPREALIKALRAKLAARSYRAKNIQTGTGGMSTVMEVSYVAPDKYHAFAETNLGTGKNGRYEMIVLGEEGYIKEPGGQWRKRRVTKEEMRRDRAKEELLIENLTSADDSAVKFVGEEELNGVRTYVYQHSANVATEIPGRSTTRTWVGATDGLLHKVELEAETVFQGKRMEIKQTTIYWDYNADIKVVAPE